MLTLDDRDGVIGGCGDQDVCSTLGKDVTNEIARVGFIIDDEHGDASQEIRFAEKMIRVP